MLEYSKDNLKFALEERRAEKKQKKLLDRRQQASQAASSYKATNLANGQSWIAVAPELEILYDGFVKGARGNLNIWVLCDEVDQIEF